MAAALKMAATLTTEATLTRRVRRDDSRRPLCAGRDAGRQPRLVPAGGVAMNHALAGHLVDERDRLRERALGGRLVLAVDGGANAFQHSAQARTELAIALAVIYTLPMRFERGCMRSHVIKYLRKP